MLYPQETSILSWALANQAVASSFKEKLPAAQFSEVRLYRSLEDALFEVAWGTARFLAHKKTVGLVLGQSDFPLFLIPLFLRESLQVKTFSVQDLTRPDWILRELGDEASIFLWPADHRFTGQKFSFHEVQAELEKKRIFSISYRHTPRISPELKVGNYGVSLCWMSDSLVVAFLGARFRAPVVFCDRQNWDSATVLNQLSQVPVAEESEGQIQFFRDRLSTEFQLLKSVGVGEAPKDRLLLAHLQKSGERMIADLRARGFRGDLATLQRVLPGQTLKSLSWWEGLPAADWIRGSLVLKSQDLSHPLLEDYFFAK